MTDDSELVVRWEINNARARFATGKVESEEFHKGGFKWTAGVERRTDELADMANFFLRCGVDRNGPWKCEAEIGVHVFYYPIDAFSDWEVEHRFCFDGDHRHWLKETSSTYRNFTNPIFNIDDKVIIEFRIKVISSERGEPISTFSAPNNRSDVILKIGDKELHVSKEYLSIHSPVFEALFFGDFAEKGKEKVEIKDIVYEEFLDLLNVLYLDTMEITDRTVPHILKLADRFQIKRVLKQSVKHLTQTNGIDMIEKLLIADQYNLASVTDHCLQLFTDFAVLAKKLKSIPEYSNFSRDMKSTICDRIVALTPEN